VFDAATIIEQTVPGVTFTLIEHTKDWAVELTK
jgi:hypothetical protein